jgi:hypothetical protein
MYRSNSAIPLKVQPASGLPSVRGSCLKSNFQYNPQVYNKNFNSY